MTPRFLIYPDGRVHTLDQGEVSLKSTVILFGSKTPYFRVVLPNDYVLVAGGAATEPYPNPTATALCALTPHKSKIYGPALVVYFNDQIALYEVDGAPACYPFL